MLEILLAGALTLIAVALTGREVRKTMTHNYELRKPTPLPPMPPMTKEEEDIAEAQEFIKAKITAFNEFFEPDEEGGNPREIGRH